MTDHVTSIASVAALRTWWDSTVPSSINASTDVYIAELDAGTYAMNTASSTGWGGKTVSGSGFGIIIRPAAAAKLTSPSRALRLVSDGVIWTLGNTNHSFVCIGTSGIALQGIQLSGPGALGLTRVALQQFIASEANLVFDDTGCRLDDGVILFDNSTQAMNVGAPSNQINNVTIVNFGSGAALNKNQDVLLKNCAFIALGGGNSIGPGSGAFASGSTNNAFNVGSTGGASPLTVTASAQFENVGSLATADLRLKTGNTLGAAGVTAVGTGSDVYYQSRGSSYAVGAVQPAAADTTPPTLSSPSGTGGTVTCSGSVSTNESGGTLYAVVTASATAPSAAQVKAGQDNTSAAALRVVSQAVSATGAQAIASGSVTAGTRYFHFMHEDAAANQSTVASSASFVVSASGDTTAPVLSSPVGTQTGMTTATVGATTDEGNGTLYAVVTTSATQPSVAQIKAGQNDGGTSAVWAGNVAVSSTGAKTLSATGLTASTTYYAHLVHTDAATNNSNRVSSASFTTASPATATLTSNPLKTNNGTLQLSAPLEAFVSNVTTGVLVVRKTGLTSHASTGVVTFTDAALTAATQYRVVWRRTDTGAEGLERLTAV